MHNTNLEPRDSFWGNLASLLEGSAASIVSFVLIPALVAVALLLPPVSLLDRIQALTYTTVDESGATILDPDGTAVVFPAEGVAQPFRVTFNSVPRVDFLNGEAGERWREAAERLPNTLIPKSPVYELAVHGDTPSQVVLNVPIPNDSEPYQTLGVYTWTGESWQHLPNHVVRADERIESRLAGVIPANFMVMQTVATPPSVTADVGASGQIPANANNSVTAMAVGGLSLRGDGALDGALQPVPAGNYEVVPILRNWHDDVVRTDLINNLLIDPGLRENQLNAITDLLVANLYAGVIIDYRGVDALPTARADFAEFIRLLAERLHAPEVNKTLAVRVESPRQISAESWDTGGYDWRVLGELVDTLIVPGPVDPRAYQAGGEMDALLAWATDNVDRAKLQIELPGLSVERSGRYLLLKGYQEALQPLIAQIQTENGSVAVPGEQVELTLDNPRILDRVTYDESIGTYYYSYLDDQGFERTVYIENAGSFAHKLDLLKQYNVTKAMVRNAGAGDIDPHIWDVARQFQQGILAASDASDLAVAYTIRKSDGSVLTQQMRPLEAPQYKFAVPGGEENVQIQAQIVQNNQPVSQAQTVALTLATPTPPVPPTPTPVPTPEVAQVVSDQVVNIREGPSTDYPVLGQIQPGNDYQITGINQAQDWWQIDTGDGNKGWVVDQLVNAAGNTDNIAVVTDIPKPPAPAIAAAAPGGNASPASAVVSAPAPTGGGSFGYGVQAHMVHNDQAGKVMQMTKGMGFGWVKQQIEWRVFEPGQGNYQWGAADGIINAANAAGISVLFSVVGAPGWAREPGFDNSVGGPPQDPQTFANFLGAMASKYCGSSLKAIEVWNEQNLHYEWGNKPLNPADYVNLLRPAYAAIKNACPSMFVISGALTPAGNNGNLAVDDFTYLEGMFQNGLADYADGIGAHPSGYNVPPSATWQTACDVIQQTGNSFNGACDSPHHSWSFRSTMEGYRNIAVKYGAANKRIWPTEFGWAAGGAFHPAYAYANDNDFNEQAQWTVEAYQMMKNWGWVGPAILWNLNFRVVADGTEKAQWGIVKNDWSPLPVYSALRDMPK